MDNIDSNGNKAIKLKIPKNTTNTDIRVLRLKRENEELDKEIL